MHAIDSAIDLQCIYQRSCRSDLDERDCGYSLEKIERLAQLKRLVVDFFVEVSRTTQFLADGDAVSSCCATSSGNRNVSPQYLQNSTTYLSRVMFSVPGRRFCGSHYITNNIQ